MKRTIATALCVFLGSMGAAAAQQASAPPTQDASLQSLDTDKSGGVNKQEYQTFMAGAFTKLDTNGNKSLSKDELSGVLSNEQIVAMDTSRDGSVDQSEFMAQVMTDFTTSDTDGDGELK